MRKLLLFPIALSLLLYQAACCSPGGGAPLASSGQATGSRLLFDEGEREVRAMRSSVYQHATAVDEASGAFNFDCSGFLDYALSRARPAALAALPLSQSARPLAQDFVHHLQGAPAGGWRRLARVQELGPGDVVAWLRPPESDSHNTGHVMLVRATPMRNPARTDEWLVPVLDSTASPHASDSRAAGQTGLGGGVIGLVVDASGVPQSYRWRGGLSPVDTATAIVLGHLE